MTRSLGLILFGFAAGFPHAPPPLPPRPHPVVQRRERLNRQLSHTGRRGSR